VRGGDLSCEAEDWGLASEGLDKDLHAFPETQHQVESALLLDVVVSKGTAILKLLASEQGTPP
jgi:hypothetical protein